ncbi:two-component system, NarL family, sensor histidine kinase BarA [Pseudomonas linyingensis]|uniref:histidine kinase n=1 Tax=Pseudomonas linyingensis TaxID=915471 RepID=A0A1H7B1G2_9PSED|nr:response regulator [Pseudomonas linyingensis]SEJ70986.1 two-component system, NarL family, sensor histidine kinase BarA [Pseudomonas linyingensis]
MFDNLGIKGRVLLLTLLPTSLLALVLGSYFVYVQLAQMNRQLTERGQLLVEHLAPLGARLLAARDTPLLERLAIQTLEQTDVRALSLLDPQGALLAHAGPRMRTEPPERLPNQLTQVSSVSATRFLLPVYGHHRQLGGHAPLNENDRLLGWIELELSHQGTLVQSYRSLLASLLLTLGGLMLSALLALRMSRAINEPLEQISHGVAQIRDGQLHTRLPTFASRELDELAAGINRMAESLQNANEELQLSVEQATEDLRNTMETIEVQNIELSLARKEALEASRIKSEFLANMSHEIRTPLNGILGFTGLLQKSGLNGRQQDYLATIEKSADSLLAIINEILDFSKIEAGKLVLDQVPFNLRDLIQDTLTILAPAAHEKQLELVSLIYRDTPQALVGDPLRLKQVLTNLVSNAIKFTRSGSIVVRAMLEEDLGDHAQLRISVQDSGVGLSETEQRTLFQAFTQVDNSSSRQAGGTGLGLVISKRLIEQMGGEIGVSSESGEGAEFWVLLNLPKAAADGDELPRALLGGRYAALLESHDLARQSLRHQLEDCGMQVIEFSSLDTLIEEAALRQHGSAPLGIALIGIDTREHPPERLSRQLWELNQQGCQALLLCPTTEQALYHASLPENYGHLQAKPVCTRKLQRTLTDLLSPRVQRLEQHAASPVASSRAPRLLCVDDNPANLMLVQTLLGDMGAQVRAVDNGYDALRAVQQERFDLVFMDVQMPGMNGRETTEAIRQWETEHRQPPMPIVALTAHALASEKRALLQCGMDDYLTKPISERQLAQVVLKWTGLALHNGEPVEPPLPERGSAAPELLVLDPAEGLRLAAGKADLAADMLAMLLDSLAADQQAIRQARASNDSAALLERIHRLHGATRYCGVPQLRAACQRSESLLKQNAPASVALDELDAAISRLAEQAAHPASEAAS